MSILSESRSSLTWSSLAVCVKSAKRRTISAQEVKSVAKAGGAFGYDYISRSHEVGKKDCKLRNDPPRSRARARI